MYNFARQTLKLILSVLFSGFILYLILNDLKDITTNTWKYFDWFSDFLIGDFGMSPNSDKIIVFTATDLIGKIEIGSNYYHTVSITLFSISTVFIISFILNSLEIVMQTKKVKWIKTTIEWFSSIHIIILGIGLFLFFREDIPVIVGIIMIAICSNAFYDLSALQFSNLSTLYNKDFVIAARAWGDSIWKHMRRSIMIDSINQFTSIWTIIFTNTLIYEIICQKPGLGYLLYTHFLEGDRSNYLFEHDLFMTLIMFIIITIFLLNYFRDLLLEYLVYIRR